MHMIGIADLITYPLNADFGTICMHIICPVNDNGLIQEHFFFVVLDFP